MKLDKWDKKFIKLDVPLGILMLVGYFCVCAPFVMSDTPHTTPYTITLIFAIILGFSMIFIANKRSKYYDKKRKADNGNIE